ncbi:hypothetical protein [Sinorhizobium fredii]|uniref:hypothetical protein n=1 Tax=Rhizobium fredii TaxID=380 RepID=UPI0033977900
MGVPLVNAAASQIRGWNHNKLKIDGNDPPHAETEHLGQLLDDHDRADHRDVAALSDT